MCESMGAWKMKSFDREPAAARAPRRLQLGHGQKCRIAASFCCRYMLLYVSIRSGAVGSSRREDLFDCLDAFSLWAAKHDFFLSITVQLGA